ncbi:MAG: T9SS type A sorting domain-containing protein [Flavobacteriales bacterium]|jgi:plastocyanin|nr:T9SS type A sorting domain-containing protein [Flavobacteriales bacterium]MDG1439297.1 T9SS type A sorting domain-containing protein [Flavobacteriales bacterium]MDG1797701.1 T9SS type A sorting domain-containing protein [Flavobacteriales bacterium]
MMKKLLVICLFSSLINPFKATIHEILVWDGYMQFLPQGNLDSVNVGDTVQWLPLDFPSMVHTITSSNIPLGAAPFDQIWQAPADTFFQYIPTHVGLYEYVCTPHIPMNMVGSFNVVGNPSSISKIVSDLNPFVYPNPTKGAINFKSNYLGFQFQIFDSNGSLVMHGKSLPNLDVSILPKGIYHLVVLGDKPRPIQLVIM